MSAATDASDLVGIDVYVTNVSISLAGRKQAASKSIISYCHPHPLVASDPHTHRTRHAVFLTVVGHAIYDYDVLL